MKINNKSLLIITYPNGGEELDAGSFRSVTWNGGDAVKCVKIEYSTDNGSTYHTIVERAANIGTFPWNIPSDLSESCLVRISDADGAPTMPVVISYEFKFKVSVSEGESLDSSHFTFRAGIPDQISQTFKVAAVSFGPDGLGGSENLLFNYATAEIQSLGQFLGIWHHARITYDMTNYSGSVWIDNQPVLINVPLNTDLDVQKSPEISLSGNMAISAKVWVDDFDIKYLDRSFMTQDSSEVVFRPLFRDNFNRYESALFPGHGGWFRSQDLVAADTQSRGKLAHDSGVVAERPTADRADAGSMIDDSEYASSPKSFKLEGSKNEMGEVVKKFSMPPKTPFCISEESFSIVAQSQDTPDGRDLRALSNRKRPEEKEGRRGKREESKSSRWVSGVSPKAGRSEAPKTEESTVQSTASGGAKSSQLLSGVPAGGAYYIYSFDGRLLAEYNIFGQCVRDYIYFGGQLIAEYRENETEHFNYYASDQVNSIRIVVNGSGTVVYSAAHDPYGGIQKSWTSTYDPSLKFSGKERDEESGLDYFGARYYDQSNYRFISVDPMFTENAAEHNSQLSNLYSFSRANPISYLDPNGKYPVYITVVRTGVAPNMGIMGTFTLETPWNSMSGYTLEGPYLGDTLANTRNSGSSILAGTYGGRLVYDAPFNTGPVDAILLTGTGNRTGIYFHNGASIDNTTGCILVGFEQNPATGNLSWGARQDMFNIAAYRELGGIDCIAMVLEGFAGLPSMDWFPEITVTIRWDPAYVARMVMIMAFRI